MMFRVAVLTVLLCANSFAIQVLHPGSGGTDSKVTDTDESSGYDMDDEELSVSALIEKANRNLDERQVIYGDIAVPTDLQNADRCVARGPVRGCLWPKARDGNVYVPYRISEQYSQRERGLILRGLESFAPITCIRFTPRDRQEDFLDIKSLDGCFSYVGRRGRNQTVSLQRRGCIFLGTIQHELLHALGFLHEQTRSDRDTYVEIRLQNVIPGRENNFRRERTINLNTSYDYNSVMHYDRFAFSRNREATIVPIPDENVPIGRARRMSNTDILRVNRLYECNSTALKTEPLYGDAFL